jgi:hypothetical protein
MLYAGVTWSELPISTSKEQEANGEIFDYEFLVDEALPIELCIEVDRGIDLQIQQDPDFSVKVTRELNSLFYIQQQVDFILYIDEDNTWSLS